jgi:peptide/nickel transport system substrate-binding protein
VYASIDEFRPLDAQTITVVWNRPFTQADRLFTVDWALPLPKHLLDVPYRQDKATLSELPYWTTDFVGAGPYRIRELIPGQHVLLEAFGGFALGSPKISEVELRYIPDPNVIVTNAIAGSVDFTLGQRIPIDLAVEMQPRWKEGQFTFEFADQRAFQMFPQFINPTPQVLLDVRFRRALAHALDRQEMVDTLASGKSFVMHTFMAPNQPEYAAIEARVPRYAYDPARSAQLIEEIG